MTGAVDVLGLRPNHPERCAFGALVQVSLTDNR
jgi:hypothetical protein